MKKSKQLLSGLLAGVLLFATACGAPSSNTPSAGNMGTDASKGRYIETDVTPPVGEEDFLGFVQKSDGTLIGYSGGLKTQFESSDGGTTWDSKPGPGEGGNELSDVQSIGMGEDGILYAFTMTYHTETQPPEYDLIKITPDGTFEPLLIDSLVELEEQGESAMIQFFEILPQDRLLLGYSYGGGGMGQPVALGEGEGEVSAAASPEEGNALSGEVTSNVAPAEEGEEEDLGSRMSFGTGYKFKVALYNLEDMTEVADLTEQAGMSVASTAQSFYLLGYDGSVEEFSLSDGKSVKKFEDGGSVNEMNFNQKIATGADGQLFSLSNKGISRIKEDGTREKVMESNAFVFANPANYINGAAVLEDETFLLLTQSSNGSGLYRYSYDPDAVINPDMVLNVWALRENPTVRTAMAEFVKKNPEAIVNFEIGMTDEDAQQTEDAIKALNTRILANDGPDVLILDECPAESYADKGMLMDLTDKINTNGMYAPLKDALGGAKGTFLIPARFKVPVIVGSEEDLAGITDLASLALATKNGPTPPEVDPQADDGFSSWPKEERPVIRFDNLEEMFDLFWAASEPSIVTPEGVNADALRSYLESLKTISDKFNLTSKEEHDFGMVVSVASGSSGSSIVAGSGIAYASRRANLGGLVLEDIFTSDLLDGFDADSISGVYKSFPGLAEGSWIPQTIAAINAGSKRPELAIDFVNALLSDEVQGSATSGLPVTQTGAEKQISDFDTLLKENDPDHEGFSYDMVGLVSQLKTPVLEDDVLSRKFLDVAKEYCGGNLDLDAAVAKTEQEVKNYLAERT